MKGICGNNLTWPILAKKPANQEGGRRGNKNPQRFADTYCN